MLIQHKFTSKEVTVIMISITCILVKTNQNRPTTKCKLTIDNNQSQWILIPSNSGEVYNQCGKGFYRDP